MREDRDQDTSARGRVEDEAGDARLGPIHRSFHFASSALSIDMSMICAELLKREGKIKSASRLVAASRPTRSTHSSRHFLVLSAMLLIPTSTSDDASIGSHAHG